MVINTPPTPIIPTPPPINMDDYVKPAPIILKGKDLQNEFDLALNELVATFPKGKFSPDAPSNFSPNKTYGQEYIEAQKRMIKLQEDYFMYKNDILKNSQSVLKDIILLDEKINSFDDQNKVLKDKLIDLKSSSFSSKGMLDDSKLSRNQLLLGNILLFFIVSSVGYTYYKKNTGNT